MKSYSEMLFRTLFSLIFLVAGGGHLLNPAGIVSRLEAAPFYDLVTTFASAGTLVTLSGVALVVGGSGLLLGLFTRLSAILLLSVLIPITLTVQTGGTSTLGPLFKNIALVGGLIHFAFSEAKSWSLDSLRRTAVLLLIVAPGIASFQPASAAAKSVNEAAKPVNEATKPADAVKVAFLVREPEQINVAMMTAKEMLSGRAEVKAAEASIVVCSGGGISAVKKGSNLSDALDQTVKAGTRVVACGLSLKKMGVEPKELHASVQVVPNGLVEMIRLKSQGYLSVDL